jgi:uncharacterized alpha-E superfamily protein
MLSRIAESLFHRTLHRALDGTARILDVHLQLARRPVDRRGPLPAARPQRDGSNVPEDRVLTWQSVLEIPGM